MYTSSPRNVAYFPRPVRSARRTTRGNSRFRADPLCLRKITAGANSSTNPSQFCAHRLRTGCPTSASVRLDAVKIDMQELEPVFTEFRSAPQERSAEVNCSASAVVARAFPYHLQIRRAKSSGFGNSRQHPRPNLIGVVKCPSVLRMARPDQCSVGAAGSSRFQRPANFKSAR